ncbi:hypothetical protein TPR58_00225 [Sphingomonas sp. HF-S3]|uniref:Uncharacterized protein n=2 Tax=Sphingomonas rustica TaxID=3103142 RepID=A0ABV0B584_9SPHN
MILLLAMQDAGPPDRPVDLAAGIARAREVIGVDPPCRTTRDDGEIVVCARREADRYRVPLVLSARPENSVPLQTAELTKDYGRIPCGQSAFTAQCGGMVGVSVSTNGQNIKMVQRDLAP